jgi:hypothetical protein
MSTIAPIISMLVCVFSAGCDHASAITKRTAAAPSLNRLSLSTSRRRRPVTLLSLNMAMIATGSVAAIRAPNTNAEDMGQPSSRAIPHATTPADTMVPNVERTRIGRMSRRNSGHERVIAASNRSGGRIRSNMKSCVKGSPIVLLRKSEDDTDNDEADGIREFDPARRERDDHCDGEHAHDLS